MISNKIKEDNNYFISVGLFICYCVLGCVGLIVLIFYSIENDYSVNNKTQLKRKKIEIERKLNIY